MLFFASLLPLVTSRPTVFFHETFDNSSWESRWVQSDRPGINGPTAAFKWSAGEWFVNQSEQLGLRTATAYRHHASSARFEHPFSNRGRDLVLQFTVKHEKSDEDLTFCAGGYLKILGSQFDQSEFGAQTPYKIMFGPDICGYDVSVIQLVFNWKGQNLHRNPEIALEFDDRDSKSHVYSLLLKTDNTYKVYMDLQEKSSGSLHEFWDFPNITIDDPTDQKPPNWIEKRRIVDPEVKKPAAWWQLDGSGWRLGLVGLRPFHYYLPMGNVVVFGVVNRTCAITQMLM